MGKHAPLHKIPSTTFDSEIKQIVFEYKFLFFHVDFRLKVIYLIILIANDKI